MFDDLPVLAALRTDMAPRDDQTTRLNELERECPAAPAPTPFDPDVPSTDESDRRVGNKPARAVAEGIAGLDPDAIADVAITVAVIAPVDADIDLWALRDPILGLVNRALPEPVTATANWAWSHAPRHRVRTRRRVEAFHNALVAEDPQVTYESPARLGWKTWPRSRRNIPVTPREAARLMLRGGDGTVGASGINPATLDATLSTTPIDDTLVIDTLDPDGATDTADDDDAVDSDAAERDDATDGRHDATGNDTRDN